MFQLLVKISIVLNWKQKSSILTNYGNSAVLNKYILYLVRAPFFNVIIQHLYSGEKKGKIVTPLCSMLLWVWKGEKKVRTHFFFLFKISCLMCGRKTAKWVSDGTRNGPWTEKDKKCIRESENKISTPKYMLLFMA